MINQYSLNDQNIILAGDFNTVLNKEDRHCSQQNAIDKSPKHLFDLLSYLHLTDMWRINEQNKHGYTWCDGQGIPKSRIDYIFLSKEFDLDIASILILDFPTT
jgi:exonuclease III